MSTALASACFAGPTDPEQAICKLNAMGMIELLGVRGFPSNQYQTSMCCSMAQIVIMSITSFNSSFPCIYNQLISGVNCK